MGRTTNLAATCLVSPDRQAEPRGRSSALPLTLGAFTPLASLPVITRHTEIKFGMTHVRLSSFVTSRRKPRQVAREKRGLADVRRLDQPGHPALQPDREAAMWRHTMLER